MSLTISQYDIFNDVQETFRTATSYQPIRQLSHSMSDLMSTNMVWRSHHLLPDRKCGHLLQVKVCSGILRCTVRFSVARRPVRGYLGSVAWTSDPLVCTYYNRTPCRSRVQSNLCPHQHLGGSETFSNLIGWGIQIGSRLYERLQRRLCCRDVL